MSTACANGADPLRQVGAVSVTFLQKHWVCDGGELHGPMLLTSSIVDIFFEKCKTSLWSKFRPLHKLEHSSANRGMKMPQFKWSLRSRTFPSILWLQNMVSKNKMWPFWDHYCIYAKILPVPNWKVDVPQMGYLRGAVIWKQTSRSLIAQKLSGALNHINPGLHCELLFVFLFHWLREVCLPQKSVATKQISTWEKQYPHWFDWLRWPDNFVGLVGFYGNFMRILSKPLLVPSWSEVSAIDPAETASTSLYTQKHHLPWSPGQHSLNKIWRHNASIEIKTEILNRQVG